MRRARTIAEELLQQGMLRSRPAASGPSYTKIANDLLDPTLWPSHGQMICAEDAIEIGLTVDRRDPEDEEWQMFWQLYCYQRMELPNASTKLFESYYACLHCDSATCSHSHPHSNHGPANGRLTKSNVEWQISSVECGETNDSNRCIADIDQTFSLGDQQR